MNQGLPETLVATLLVSVLGCGPSLPPDPRVAVRAYADAARRGDADEIYRLLSASSRQARTLAQVREMVSAERPELAQQAEQLSARDTRLQATARLHYADGEAVTMDLDGGRYWVTSAGALPGAGRSPEETLDALRRVLARRNYAGLIRILSPTTRAAIEHDLRALVDGLSDPGALPLRMNDDAATVTVPGGHHVTLRREEGLWKVDDFD